MVNAPYDMVKFSSKSSLNGKHLYFKFNTHMNKVQYFSFSSYFMESLTGHLVGTTSGCKMKQKSIRRFLLSSKKKK